MPVNGASDVFFRSDRIQLKELLAIFRRYLFTSATIILACTVAAGTAAYLLPKTFSSKAVLNIQSAYFRIPLVSDLVAITNDSMEFRAERETLLRYALNNDFLDKLGAKHRLFKYPLESPLHALERESLLKSIQYYSIGSNSYHVSVTAGTADDAQQLTRAVLEQMISTLISERLAKLTNAKTALQASLDTLDSELDSGDGASPVTDAQAEKARDALRSEEAVLASLERRFTALHPTVTEQRRKVERLRAVGNGSLPPAAKDTQRLSGAGPVAGSARTVQELHAELFKKYNYLNLVIDMEKTTSSYPYLTVLEQPALPLSPLFPKKRSFVIGGAVAGIVLSIFWMLLSELRRGTFLSAAHAARILEAPLLGALPEWDPAKRTG